jgi:hypothetical protein
VLYEVSLWLSQDCESHCRSVRDWQPVMYQVSNGSHLGYCLIQSASLSRLSQFARLHHHRHVTKQRPAYVLSNVYFTLCPLYHCSACAQQRQSPGAITLPVRYEVSYRLEVLLFHSHSLKLCGERCAENLAFRVKHSRMVGSTVAATYNQKNTYAPRRLRALTQLFSWS